MGSVPTRVLGPQLNALPHSPARGAGLSQGKSFAALCWQLGREIKPEQYPDAPKPCRCGAAPTQPLITALDSSLPSASVGALQSQQELWLPGPGGGSAKTRAPSAEPPLTIPRCQHLGVQVWPRALCPG